MKKFSKIIRSKKVKIAELIIAIIFIIISITMLFVDVFDVFEIDNNTILTIIWLNLTLLYMSSLVERYGVLDEISSKIGLNSVENIYLSSRLDIEVFYNIERRFKESSEIHVLTTSLDAVFSGGNFIFLKNALKDGMKMKAIILNPSSAAAEEFFTNKMLDEVDSPIERGLKYLIKYSNELEYFKNNVQFKVTDINFPYTIWIVKTKKEISYIKVDLLAINIEKKSRRCFIIKHNDKENIDFFVNQFNLIWNDIQTKTIENIEDLNVD